MLDPADSERIRAGLENGWGDMHRRSRAKRRGQVGRVQFELVEELEEALRLALGSRGVEEVIELGYLPEFDCRLALSSFQFDSFESDGYGPWTDETLDWVVSIDYDEITIYGAQLLRDLKDLHPSWFR